MQLSCVSFGSDAPVSLQLPLLQPQPDLPPLPSFPLPRGPFRDCPDHELVSTFVPRAWQRAVPDDSDVPTRRSAISADAWWGAGGHTLELRSAPACPLLLEIRPSGPRVLRVGWILRSGRESYFLSTLFLTGLKRKNTTSGHFTCLVPLHSAQARGFPVHGERSVAPQSGAALQVGTRARQQEGRAHGGGTGGPWPGSHTPSLSSSPGVTPESHSAHLCCWSLCSDARGRAHQAGDPHAG